MGEAAPCPISHPLFASRQSKQDKKSKRTETGISWLKSSSREAAKELMKKKNSVLQSLNSTIKFTTSLNKNLHLNTSSKPKDKPVQEAQTRVSSVNGVKKNSQVLPRPENKSQSEALTTGSTKKPRSTTVFSTFTFRSDERAARRKEFFQKLEEKGNTKRTDKTQLPPKLKEKHRTMDSKLPLSILEKAKPSTIERKVTTNIVPKGDRVRALTTSISLDSERQSTFSYNRIPEDVQKYIRPGAVAEKKAFFEAYNKNLTPIKGAKPPKKENRPLNFSNKDESEPNNKGTEPVIPSNEDACLLGTNPDSSNSEEKPEIPSSKDCSLRGTNLEIKNTDDVIPSARPVEHVKPVPDMVFSQFGDVKDDVQSSNKGVEPEIRSENRVVDDMVDCGRRTEHQKTSKNSVLQSLNSSIRFTASLNKNLHLKTSSKPKDKPVQHPQTRFFQKLEVKGNIKSQQLPPKLKEKHMTIVNRKLPLGTFEKAKLSTSERKVTTNIVPKVSQRFGKKNFIEINRKNLISSRSSLPKKKLHGSAFC